MSDWEHWLPFHIQIQRAPTCNLQDKDFNYFEREENRTGPASAIGVRGVSDPEFWGKKFSSKITRQISSKQLSGDKKLPFSSCG